MLGPRLPYALGFGLIFVVLVVIGMFVETGPVRHYGGDLLVVIWIYAGARMVSLGPKGFIALLTFILAALIEFGQAGRLLARLGLEENDLARTLIGSSFDPLDLAVYAVGALIAWRIDRHIAGRDY